MIFISLHLAAAATAKLSDHSDRQDFLLSLPPSVGYFLLALTIWLVANRRAVRTRKLSLRSILLLIAVLSPGMALLQLVHRP